ncbi:alpha-N-methyltransferase NTM1 [Apodospora peruviana]|uniref:Alpha N-terminal protein methyltransferase 1 n=1 Tax=Apodospora peruviana TaxID=516989 RepID=A0AAE0IIZ2_9PEZI|nr:alpha-N-methyltransferase NTM1 [Apodospora peruviana]
MASKVNNAAGKSYWEGIEADVDGMLGGIPSQPGFQNVSKVDLQGSKNFLAKLGIGERNGLRVVDRALEGGAGIGRVTEGLLVKVASKVDIIEPTAKFTAALEGKPGVGKIHNVGLEEWRPAVDDRYDLVWVQWCAGHLNDEQLVSFLDRCKSVLTNPKDAVIVVKENTTTNGEDDFDEVDSSVTRGDAKFLSIFKQAGLKVAKAELQRGLPQTQALTLFPIKMYALKPV